MVEQTTIGTPALAFGAPQPFSAAQPATVARVRAIPSILSSILNGRDEIANAISPLAARLAVPGPAPSTGALTTATAQVQNSTLTPAAKKAAKKTARKASSAPTTTRTGPKHAKHAKK